jgi:DNA-binding transcriptional MerR regulator
MKKAMTLKDVVAELHGQIRPHQIEYLLANGIIPEPELRLGGRRIFTPADVRRLAKHFGVTLSAETAQPAAEPVGRKRPVA